MIFQSYVPLQKTVNDDLPLKQFCRCNRYVRFEGACTVVLVAGE
jgi:hypothetical protein